MLSIRTSYSHYSEVTCLVSTNTNTETFVVELTNFFTRFTIWVNDSEEEEEEKHLFDKTNTQNGQYIVQKITEVKYLGQGFETVT